MFSRYFLGETQDNEIDSQINLLIEGAQDDSWYISLYLIYTFGKCGNVSEQQPYLFSYKNAILMKSLAIQILGYELYITSIYV